MYPKEFDALALKARGVEGEQAWILRGMAVIACMIEADEVEGSLEFAERLLVSALLETYLAQGAVYASRLVVVAILAEYLKRMKGKCVGQVLIAFEG